MDITVTGQLTLAIASDAPCVVRGIDLRIASAPTGVNWQFG